MRIAYLILCQDCPELALNLINRVKGSKQHCFVHIDAGTRYDFEDLENLEGVTLVQPRIKVHQEGFSRVKAILNLMQQAVTRGDFDYYILLSGNDYPIRSQEFIEFYLDRNYRRDEYIQLRKMQGHTQGQAPEQLQNYHFECNRSQPQSLKDFMALLGEQSLRMLKIHKKLDFQPYEGSEWWALTHACVSYLLEFVSRNPEFVQIFRTADNPATSFFHTIIAHSHFARYAKNTLTYEEVEEEEPMNPTFFKEESLDLFFENLYVQNAIGRFLPLFVRKFNRYNAYLQETIDEEIADFDHELALYEVYHSELLQK